MSDDVANKLIAELEGGGEQVDVGQFTLDEAAARRKLAAYRLVDLRAWLCLVIEAAHCHGADWVRIRTDDDVLTLAFDGVPPELDGLFGSVFMGRAAADDRQRGRRKLAIALDAVLVRPGVKVEIHSGGASLELEHDAEPRLGTSERDGFLLRVEAPDDDWPELALVRERCRFSPLQIDLDDEQISFGTEHALDVCPESMRWPIVDGHRTIGRYGVAPGYPNTSVLYWLCDGVLCEEIALGGACEVAIIDGPFRRDVGEHRLLRAAEFERIMASVEALRERHGWRPPPARKPERPPTPAPAQDRTRMSVSERVLIPALILGVLFLAGVFVAKSWPRASKHEIAPPISTTEIAAIEKLMQYDLGRCMAHADGGPYSLEFTVVVDGSTGEAGSINLRGVHGSNPTLAACARTAAQRWKYPLYHSAYETPIVRYPSAR